MSTHETTNGSAVACASACYDIRFKYMERTYTFKINAIKDGETIEEETKIEGCDELGIMTDLQCKYPKGEYWQVKATLIKQEFRFNQFD